MCRVNYTLYNYNYQLPTTNYLLFSIFIIRLLSGAWLLYKYRYNRPWACVQAVQLLEKVLLRVNACCVLRSHSQCTHHRCMAACTTARLTFITYDVRRVVRVRVTAARRVIIHVYSYIAAYNMYIYVAIAIALVACTHVRSLYTRYMYMWPYITYIAYSYIYI